MLVVGYMKLLNLRKIVEIYLVMTVVFCAGQNSVVGEDTFEAGEPSTSGVSSGRTRDSSPPRKRVKVDLRVAPGEF